MKKRWIIIIIIILLITILLINIIHSTGTMKCTYKSINDLYEIETIYNIEYTKYNVDSLYSKEIIKSNDKKMLKEYKTSLELVYNKYNSLKYYDNSITLKGNTLTTETKINYKKININELISIDKSNKKLFKNNRVSLNTLKKIYKNNGAKCIYK